MALINCKECGKKISDKAKACPNCGAPVAISRASNPQPVFATPRVTTTAEYYFLDGNGTNYGPFDMGQLRKLLEEGAISEKTLCAKSGDTEWKPFASILCVTSEPKPSSGNYFKPKQGDFSERGRSIKKPIVYILLTVITLLILFLLAGPKVTAGAAALPVLISIWGIGGFIYFYPTIAAGQRNHKNTFAIFIVNFAFGWTLIGWVFALVWAVKKD